MFDIGWLEMLVIGIVALIVVGPKDLPGMFRTVGTFVGKAKGMAREFQRTMEAAADESGLKEATDKMKDLDSLGQAKNSMKDYAKNYVTQKDQKAADAAKSKAGAKSEASDSEKEPQDWSAEASKIASPAAKTTAPVKAKTPKAEPTKAAPKKAPAKKAPSKAASKGDAVADALSKAPKSKPAPKPKTPKAKTSS